MSDYQRKKIELELKMFTTKNFERPGDCKNLDQIRFYIRELASKINELEESFNYVPAWAYSLLAQYNARQNRFMLVEFRNNYS
jgi:hypothetical protein